MSNDLTLSTMSRWRFPIKLQNYFELRAGNDPTYLGYKSSASPLMLTKRKWRKVLKVVYTEGIEPSFIVFKTIVLTISRSNTFNHHPFVELGGYDPPLSTLSEWCFPD